AERHVLVRHHPDRGDGRAPGVGPVVAARPVHPTGGPHGAPGPARVGRLHPVRENPLWTRSRFGGRRTPGAGALRHLPGPRARRDHVTLKRRRSRIGTAAIAGGAAKMTNASRGWPWLSAAARAVVTPYAKMETTSSGRRLVRNAAMSTICAVSV